MRAFGCVAAGLALGLPLLASCSSSDGEAMPGGGAAGASGNGTSGGGVGVSGGGMVAAGGRGSAGTATGNGGTAGASGSLAGMGGAIAGMGGAAGSGVGGGFVGGGAAGAPPVPPLDCGGRGAVIENHGPTANRVNYVILGDGYSQAELDTTFMAHIQTAMTKRFSDPIGQVYLRYRKFVNICAIKIPSTPICGSSAFRCCGNDSSRLASCDRTLANDAISENLPESFEVDWRAVVLNGSSWWNTGATLMLWSGAHRDAPGAALHEGGHGFHQLADEYGDCGSDRVNNTANAQTSGGRWDPWIDFNQTPGTGRQGLFACEGGSGYRPSDNSMMNSLFGDDPDTSFNAVSREKMIMDIWRIVESPWDAVVPPAGAVTNPASLTLNVIDPTVINVDWSVDGNMVAVNGGPTFNIGAAGLAPGTHMVSARAYDNAGMDLVRQKSGTTFNRQYWAMNASKTVTWTVTIQ